MRLCPRWGTFFLSFLPTHLYLLQSQSWTQPQGKTITHCSQLIGPLAAWLTRLTCNGLLLVETAAVLHRDADKRLQFFLWEDLSDYAVCICTAVPCVQQWFLGNIPACFYTRCLSPTRRSGPSEAAGSQRLQMLSMARQRFLYIQIYLFHPLNSTFEALTELN